MRIIYPEGVIGLLDLLADSDADQLWRKLSSGHLASWRWVTETGDFLEIESGQWARHVKVIEEGGHVVTRHPVELIERRNLHWIMPPRWPGHDNRNDMMVVIEADARRLFPKKPISTDKGGRPEHPAKKWYAQRGFSRDGLTVKKLQREMERVTGEPPPSESTIREWEKDARKPPTET